MFVLFSACAFALQSSSVRAAEAVTAPGISFYYYPDDAPEDAMPRFVPICDPIEPLNRCMYGLNDGLMFLIVSPVGKVYKLILPEPVRDCIRRAGRNLAFPTRGISSLLQGKGEGAWRETKRFGINTTLGILGLFDPAWSRYSIRPCAEDFGQTFAKWGWKRSCYIMLPLLGPKTGRDTLAIIPDAATNLTTYAGGTFFRFNELVYAIAPYWRLRDAKDDPYLWTRDMWALMRKGRLADVDGLSLPPADTEEDEAAQETLRSVFFGPDDDGFVDRSRKRKAEIEEASEGKTFRYNIWLQPGQAPVVYIVPGFGGHRTGSSSLALAEMVYAKGLSAVTVSSSMSADFVEQASTVPAPGFLPFDAHDLHVVLDTIHHQLREEFPDHIDRNTPTALMGVSLGGIHTLFIALAEGQDELISFDRYVAINPPIDLTTGMRKLDQFYRSPMKWEREERVRKLNQLVMKVVVLAKRMLEQNSALKPSSGFPLSEQEAQHLVGLVFRFGLRDAMYVSQKRMTPGDRTLKSSMSRSHRAQAYDECIQYSFEEYARKAILGMLERREADLFRKSCYDFVRSRTGKAEGTPWRFKHLSRLCNLRTYGDRLQGNSRVRVFLNKNDFLLDPGDIEWVGQTLHPSQLHVFPRGGHLGNLYKEEVQERIMRELAGLRKDTSVAVSR